MLGRTSQEVVIVSGSVESGFDLRVRLLRYILLLVTGEEVVGTP